MMSNDAEVSIAIATVKNKAREIWEDVYNLSFLDNISFDWNKKGVAAASVKPVSGHIRLNKVLFEDNKKEFLVTTIPHEVAHIITYHIYGKTGHGKDWKYVMSRMGYPSNRCHNYDITKTARRQKRYTFKCSCSDHVVSAKMKGCILNNNSRHYKCKLCDGNLILVK